MRERPHYLVFLTSVATVLAGWWFGVLGHVITRDAVSIALGISLALNLGTLAMWFLTRQQGRAARIERSENRQGGL